MRRTLREPFEYGDEYRVAQSLLAAALAAGGAALIYKAMTKPGKPRGMIEKIRMAAMKRLPKAHKPTEHVRPSELKHEIRRTLVRIAKDLR